MKQAKRTGIILAMILTLLVGWGTTVMAAVEVEGDAYVGIFSKYLWRGFDLSGGLPVAQGGMDLSAGGFTLSYWSNAQLSDDPGTGLQGGEINETDLTLDYSSDLNDKVSISVGNTFYSLDAANDTNELYLTAALNTLLNPSLTIYWDWDQAEKAGLYYLLSASHDFEITKSLALSLSASVGYNQENYSVDESYSNWHNAELGCSLNYALAEQLSLSPSFVYSTPLSDDARNSAGIDDETAAGLTLTFSF